MTKTTVIYHRADFDGLFCREIAKKFLPDAELIGWDFGDPQLMIPDGKIYILDLPCDRPFGFDFAKTLYHDAEAIHVSEYLEQIRSEGVWIDHHKSSIESHPATIPGYRIDGVAACRLAWQWFTHPQPSGDWKLPFKDEFIDRKVSEPLAVQLAGEYDIWDKRDPDAELFQHGLRSQELTEPDWDKLLRTHSSLAEAWVADLLTQGRAVQYAKTQENKDIITSYGFTVQFEGLTFLACNHARYNSLLFTAGLKPEHDALLGFKYNGKRWEVSLYHAPGKEQHDLSKIAVKHGGGGHRGACGFVADKLPWLT